MGGNRLKKFYLLMALASEGAAIGLWLVATYLFLQGAYLPAIGLGLLSVLPTGITVIYHLDYTHLELADELKGVRE